MKIGLITYALMIGGIERMIMNQARYFTDHGYEVEIIETQWAGVWKSEFENRGYTVDQVLPNPLQSRSSHALRIAERLQNFDILFLFDVPYVKAILGLLDPKIKVYPVVSGNLDSMIFNAVSNLDEVDQIVVVSPLLKDRIVQDKLAPESQVAVIPNCVDIPELDGLERKSDSRKFLFLGRLLHSDKAILDIPRFMKQVLLTEDFDYVHFYGDGPDREKLQNLINELGLSEKLILKGTVAPDQTYKLMRDYDFLLLPSYIEGHPLVLLEGMAMGLVPFASLLPRQTDIVVANGENGYLAKPGDLEGFEKIIIQGMQDADRQKTSKNARETIVSKFSVDIIISEYESLFKTESNQRTTNRKRSGKVAVELLGDLPTLPLVLVRPIRKALKLAGLWK